MNEKSSLIDLIKENPELPIYAWVEPEVVQDDSIRWLGEISAARVVEYVSYEESGIGVIRDVKDDKDVILEWIESKQENQFLEADDIEKIFDALPTQKAIFVYVDTPDVEQLGI